MEKVVTINLAGNPYQLDETAYDNVRVAAESRASWDRSKFDPGKVADEMLDRVGIRDLLQRVQVCHDGLGPDRGAELL